MAQASFVRRDGFTLIEVIVALVLIAGVALAMGAAIGRLSGIAARGGQSLRAAELARARITTVVSDPAYSGMEARYNGTETATSLQGFVRTTAIQRVRQNGVGGLMLDYKIVDVQVTGPGVQQAVTRRAVVAAP
jgi:prepilin-type N-terminal cleavage/methylation domain-containing protein